MKTRIAVIGASHWHTPMYLDALDELGAAVVAVSDQSPAIASRIASGFGCPWYSDHRALLESTRPDFVLAMPRHCDAAMVAADLLHLDLPFAIEKPIGLHADQLRPLVERARRQGTYVAVPLINRYRPIWAALGPVGLNEARHAHFRIINGPARRYTAAGCDWMLDPDHSGGGALRNLGIHAADALLMLTGGNPDALEITGASLGFAAGDRVEDYAVALLAGPNGLTAIVEAGYTYSTMAAGMTRGGDSEWRVATRSTYLVDRDESLLVVEPAGKHVSTGENSAVRYRRFVADSLAGFRFRKPPVADLESCYRAMVLVDAIYRRAGAPWLTPVRGGASS